MTFTLRDVRKETGLLIRAATNQKLNSGSRKPIDPKDVETSLAAFFEIILQKYEEKLAGKRTGADDRAQTEPS